MDHDPKMTAARELARSMGLQVIEPQHVPGHREVRTSTAKAEISQRVQMNVLLSSEAISARCAEAARTPLVLPGGLEINGLGLK